MTQPTVREHQEGQRPPPGFARVRGVESIERDNRQLVETLLWIAKSCLDERVRRRAQDVLRELEPELSNAWLGDSSESALDGEWCI